MKSVNTLYLIILLLISSSAFSQQTIAEDLIGIGNEYFQQGDYKNAIKEFNKSIELDPSNPIAHENRGHSKFELGDYRGAIMDFTKALKLCPKYKYSYGVDQGKIHNAIAICYCQIKDYETGILEFNKAITIHPFNHEYYYNRGYAKQQMKRYKEAATDYTLAINYDSKYINAYINRGLIYLTIYNAKNKACLDFSKAGELGSDQAYALIKKYCN